MTFHRSTRMYQGAVALLNRSAVEFVRGIQITLADDDSHEIFAQLRISEVFHHFFIQLANSWPAVALALSILANQEKKTCMRFPCA